MPAVEDEMMMTEEAIIASLTPRERETLGWMARGLSYRNIAAYMGVSHNTVRTWGSYINAKLGTHSQIEAVRRAYELGLIR